MKSVEEKPRVRLNDRNAWEIAFKSLLGDDYFREHPELSVELDGDSVKISSFDTELPERLRCILNSPGSIRGSLEYRLSAQRSVAETVSTVVEDIDTSAVTAQMFFKKIMSEELLFEASLLHPKAIDEQQVLRLELPKSEKIKQIWLDKLEVVKGVLNAGFDQLRNAYLHHALITNCEYKRDECVSALLDKVCGVDDGQLFFNYGMLLQMMFPPTQELTSSNSAEGFRHIIRYSRDELTTYLAGTFTEGFMLHIDGAKAHSVLVSPQDCQVPNNQYIVVLDTSSSMDSNFAQYIEQARHFINQITAIAGKSDILRIVRFSDTSSVTEFCLGHANAKDRINEHIDELSAYGSTYLDGTLLSELKACNVAHNMNTTLVLFTDGCDNISSVSEKNGLALQRTALAQQTNPPKIYTMGLGSYYSQDHMSDLALRTGATHTHLKTIADFKLIEQHLDRMQLPRVLLRFVQGAYEETVASYQGHLTAGPILDTHKPFTVNGRGQSIQPKTRVVPYTSTHGTGFSVVSDKSASYTPALDLAKGTNNQITDDKPLQEKDKLSPF